jgi:acyl dehydratase
MATQLTLDELAAHVGESLGSSEWLLIDQETIDTFARVTHDEQWIHVDPVRAASGPFGATVAHGYFTLSLCATFLSQCFSVTDAAMALNYGMERVRFPAPVPVGARVRGHAELQSVQEVAGGVQVVIRVTVESDASPKPACVADTVARFLR